MRRLDPRPAPAVNTLFYNVCFYPSPGRKFFDEVTEAIYCVLLLLLPLFLLRLPLPLANFAFPPRLGGQS